ncbi:radical SAM protein [Candidatus Pacearchaeota archaeon]|nr:radical SAM protein [Candidatus Pacearchaeota archaeon]
MAKEFYVDSHKLIYHPKRISDFKENGDCYPIYVEFGLTNACNHKCIFCALDFLTFGGKFIDKDVMLKALKDMADNGVKSVMFAGEGEPLLHKDIGLFAKTAKNLGLDVSITSNGVLFNEDKIKELLPNLTWIRFSIDAGTKEGYAKIHGTDIKDFDKLLNNLKKAVKFKKENNLDVTIGSQFLMIPQNMHEGAILAGILKEIGLDNLQLKPYAIHPKSINNLSKDNYDLDKLHEEVMKFDSDDFRVLFRKETLDRLKQGFVYNECHGLPFFALVDSKGNIIPCNIFYDDPDFYYGNLNEKSFSEIWRGNNRKEVIEKIKNKGIHNCRIGCRLDPINRYLQRLKNPHIHDNFI